MDSLFPIFLNSAKFNLNVLYQLWSISQTFSIRLFNLITYYSTHKSLNSKKKSSIFSLFPLSLQKFKDILSRLLPFLKLDFLTTYMDVGILKYLWCKNNTHFLKCMFKFTENFLNSGKTIQELLKVFKIVCTV